MIIKVNNGRELKISPCSSGGIVVENADGCKDCYGDGDIVMLLNLVHYMKDSGCKSVYLKDGDSYEEFRLFQ